MYKRATLFVVLVISALIMLGCTANPLDLAKTDNASPAALNQAAGNPNSTLSQSPPATNTITLTMDVVAKHNTAADCWMVINGLVLDLSSFTNHPGGGTYIPYCGKDGTSGFNAYYHDSRATAMMKQYELGTLGQTITLR